MLQKRFFIPAINLFATVQFVWCYLWLTRPYVSTALYSQGEERMPFQGRCLMVPVMQWAHGNRLLQWATQPFGLSQFWFPKPVQPEVLVQAAIDVSCLLIAGWFTVRIYEASSRRNLLTPFVYPLFLTVCAATYVMHTVQNFRFIYDLPSLAFFSAAMYLLYFRRHWALFAALFLVATVNRETTLLLLPLYLINEAFEEQRFQWRRMFRPGPFVLTALLALIWIGWTLLVRYIFRDNASEFYPRFSWNIKSLLAPLAWPQLLSACGYMLVAVVLLRRRIPDLRLRAWLWIVPVWIVFMFTFGILIETRVFGELIAFVVCAACLIAEETIVLRLERTNSPVSILASERLVRRVASASHAASGRPAFAALVCSDDSQGTPLSRFS